jgi:hypothetical protein
MMGRHRRLGGLRASTRSDSPPNKAFFRMSLEMHQKLVDRLHRSALGKSADVTEFRPDDDRVS